MRLTFTVLLFTLSITTIQAQSIAGNVAVRDGARVSGAKVNLNGQWRGSFNETSSSPHSLLGNSNTTYVLEINVRGSTVSGYSYTYFTDLGPKRYYTICRVTGTVNRGTNSVVVTEVERIRYNTPPTILNCFQTHRLTFERGADNTEYLKGDWFPAPNQNCGGKGETVLSRQTLTRTPFAVKVPPKKDEVARNTRPAPPASRQQAARPPAKAQRAEPEKRETEKVTTVIPSEKEPTPAPAPKRIVIENPPMPVYGGYEKRKNVLVKTIHLENPVFQVDFYDNGEIDGDSISVFYNGKLVVANKMLTAQPLTLTLSVDKKYKNNVIIMYADNLGSIPPNTAVMIVRDGNKRYEVRMESDLGKSGSVIFRHEDD